MSLSAAPQTSTVTTEAATPDRELGALEHVPSVHTIDDVITQVESYWDDPQLELIRRAYALADAGHRGQMRKSGEPYISHPVEVAYLVTEIGLDPKAVAAALCHDLIEDCGVELDTIEAALGPEVALLVDGLTKVDRLKFSSTEAARAATLRKLLVAVAKDVRVLIIKLADRLHNMRTLAPLDVQKATRIATETLEVYVPLAHRLGMSQVQTELEDLAFAVCYPDRYGEIDRLIAVTAPARDSDLSVVVDLLTQALSESGISVDDVASRAKGHWSIYSKMIEQHKSFETITDLLGVRVIVDNVQDCYGALGVIHGLWAPVAGRLKDYVATPTYSLYQALHTTVIGPGGRPVEIQLRTVEMNERAERGIAAHWGYKGAGRRRNNEKEPAWLSRVLDWDKESSGPEEFMSGLRAELDADEEVVVFTPKGDLVALPAGSGPLDFAYSVHTEVGHSCVGAKVNGRIVPLAHRLTSGDTVEVMTSRSGSSGPKEAWLRMAVTAKARGRIRQALAAQRRGTDVEAGRGLLKRALRGSGIEAKADDFGLMANVAQTLGYQSAETLFTALGTRHLKAQVVVARLKYYLSPSTADQVTKPTADIPGTKTVSALDGRGRKFLSNDPQIIVEGMNGMLVRLANCCSPMPGQPIVGFVTSGRGVSVHTTNCPSLAALSGDRQVEVGWWDNTGQSQTDILIEALDRPGLLVDVVRALSGVGLDIAGSNTTVGDDRVARQCYTVICSGTEQLDAGLEAAAQIQGVFSATRPAAHTKG
jgi:guanosine-3',5'-bis(diphosphate) 3'-pyrophosphohydrolase